MFKPLPQNRVCTLPQCGNNILSFSLSSPPLLSFSPTDPQVKVIGNPSAVQKARELILADLDAKATRVTLKIDIPFSEHSHVIGKEGCNIKKGTV